MKSPSLRFPRTIARNIRRVLAGRAIAALLCILLITTGQPGEVAVCIPTPPTAAGL